MSSRKSEVSGPDGNVPITLIDWTNPQKPKFLTLQRTETLLRRRQKSRAVDKLLSRGNTTCQQERQIM
ncbi:hypothetical protein INR49_000730 [Caranx melampygus]|nr:hypothetical protein INR49_000730 [Caranx melampygus]